MSSGSFAFAPVVEIARVMQAHPRPWWISGGWAIDLFLGRVTRDHEDVEVGTFFSHQGELRQHLDGWEMKRIRNDTWETWEPDDVVAPPEFQLQMRSRNDPSVVFDVFLNPMDGGDWVSRRHDGLRRRASTIMAVSSGRDQEPAGIPYLVPDIQLLYKAKNHRAKDEADFETVLPLLGTDARGWLREALSTYHAGDPWIAQL